VQPRVCGKVACRRRMDYLPQRGHIAAIK